MQLVALDSRVVDEATVIRAAENFRTPDALHLAAAIVGGAKVFLAGDKQLARFKRLMIEVI
jgi:predicted nucleic acid-binding protein